MEDRSPPALAFIRASLVSGRVLRNQTIKGTLHQISNQSEITLYPQTWAGTISKPMKNLFRSRIVEQRLSCPLKENDCHETFYIFIKEAACRAGSTSGQLLHFFFFFCCCKSCKSRQGCNLLPLASCKAIPSTPAVINLSQ